MTDQFGVGIMVWILLNTGIAYELYIGFDIA